MYNKYITSLVSNEHYNVTNEYYNVTLPITTLQTFAMNILEEVKPVG